MITGENYKAFKCATHCCFCKKPLGKDKVKDHDHLTGKYRGAAHNSCNLEECSFTFAVTLSSSRDGTSSECHYSSILRSSHFCRHFFSAYVARATRKRGTVAPALAPAPVALGPLGRPTAPNAPQGRERVGSNNCAKHDPWNRIVVV